MSCPGQLKKQTDKKTMRRQKQFAVFHLPVFHRDWGEKGKDKKRKRQKDNEKTKTACSVSLTCVSQGLRKKGKDKK